MSMVGDEIEGRAGRNGVNCRGLGNFGGLARDRLAGRLGAAAPVETQGLKLSAPRGAGCGVGAGARNPQGAPTRVSSAATKPGNMPHGRWQASPRAPSSPFGSWMSTRTDIRTQANGSKDAVLREFAPPSIKRLRESQDAIPALAKDDIAARDIEAVLPMLPTTHEMRRADARDLDDLRSDSVHLVLTSPPYWTLKQYN